MVQSVVMTPEEEQHEEVVKCICLLRRTLYKSIKKNGYQTILFLHDTLTKLEMISACSLEEFEAGSYLIQFPPLEILEQLLQEHFHKIKAI